MAERFQPQYTIQQKSRSSSANQNAETANIYASINTVDADLAALDADVFRKDEVTGIVNNAGSTVMLAAGVAFPAGPYTNGQMFFRTDENQLYAWLGAAWTPQRTDLQISNNTLVITRDANGRISKVEEKTAAGVVVDCINVTQRGGDGKIEKLTETIAGKTITYTPTYDSTRQVSSVSRVVI